MRLETLDPREVQCLSGPPKWTRSKGPQHSVLKLGTFHEAWQRISCGCIRTILPIKPKPAVVGEVCCAACNDDVLPKAQFHGACEQLVCGNRGETCF